MSGIKVKILEDIDQEVWNQFVDNSPWGDILQFWQWGEIKRQEGWRPLRLGVIRDGALILGAQILLKKAGIFGNYAYIPHGPVFRSVDDLREGLPKLTEFLASHSKVYNFIAIEIEPRIGQPPVDENTEEGVVSNSENPLYINDYPENIQQLLSPEIPNILEENGFVATGRNMQPKYKLYYDLNATEEDLISQCHKNTRYNIRLAAKKGVEIVEYLPDDPQIEEKLSVFYDLLVETQERAKGYPIRSLDSFITMFRSFRGTKHLSLFEARYQGDTIVMNISQRTKYWSSSFYAGSNRLHGNVKAPYLLRWQSILSAQQYGSKLYDFWGIIPRSKEHAGYSDHKLSFGGIRVDNYGLLALTINPFKYFLWNSGITLRTEGKIWLNKSLWKIKEYLKNLRKK